MENKEKIEIEQTKKKRKNDKIFKYSMFTLSHILAGGFFIGLGLIWQDSYTLTAWTNALWLSFVMVFFIGWIMFIYNQNIISSFVHSIKTFGLMVVGKKPEKSYYEVKVEVEENQIPKGYFYLSFGISILFLIPAIITLVIALKK